MDLLSLNSEFQRYIARPWSLLTPQEGAQVRDTRIVMRDYLIIICILTTNFEVLDPKTQKSFWKTDFMVHRKQSPHVV